LVTWADYLISRVRYTKNPKRIDEVEIYTDEGEKLKKSDNMKRETVVSLLKKKLKFMTIKKDTNGWKRGDNVIPYEADGEYFIRTDGNKTKEDNLGQLPEF